MSEPKRIQAKTEKIAYRSVYGEPDRRTAVVRRNRTAAETEAQLERIIRTYGATNPRVDFDENGNSQVGDAFRRTMMALDATGRSTPTFNGRAVLVSRRNNRRS